MEDFIATVRDPNLERRLGQAIQSRGAFRRFKDTLGQDRSEQAPWYGFQAGRERERVRGWLEAEGIELAVNAG